MRSGPRLLIAAVLLCSGCTGLHGITDPDDVSRSLEPPPRDWEAAVLFDLWPSSRVEFYNGKRSRVVTPADSIPDAFGRTAYYRAYVRDSSATVFHIRVRDSFGADTNVHFPLRIERGAFYAILVRLGTYDSRSLGTNRFRAYPIPVSAQKLPSDSLYITWGARSRDCWTCPT